MENLSTKQNELEMVISDIEKSLKAINPSMLLLNGNSEHNKNATRRFMNSIINVLPVYTLLELVDCAVKTKSRVPILLIRARLEFYSKQIKDIDDKQIFRKIIPILSFNDHDILNLCKLQLDKIFKLEIDEANEDYELESVLCSCPKQLESYDVGVKKLFLKYIEMVNNFETTAEIDDYFHRKTKLNIIDCKPKLWRSLTKAIDQRREILMSIEQKMPNENSKNPTKQNHGKIIAEPKILIGEDRYEGLLKRYIEEGLVDSEFCNLYHYCESNTFKIEYLKVWSLKLDSSSSSNVFIYQELLKLLPADNDIDKMKQKSDKTFEIRTADNVTFVELYDFICELNEKRCFPDALGSDNYQLLKKSVIDKFPSAPISGVSKIRHIMSRFNHDKEIFIVFMDRFFQLNPTIKNMVEMSDKFSHFYQDEKSIYVSFIPKMNETIISRLNNTEHLEIIVSTFYEVGNTEELADANSYIVQQIHELSKQKTKEGLE